MKPSEAVEKILTIMAVGAVMTWAILITRVVVETASVPPLVDERPYTALNLHTPAYASSSPCLVWGEWVYTDE
jgi:hypothetical protein